MCEKEDGRYEVRGITSWGGGCGVEENPGVYANVYHFRKWIQEKLNGMIFQLTCLTFIQTISDP